MFENRPATDFVVSLIFGIWILLALGCESPDQQAVTSRGFVGPDQEGWNSRLTVTKSGRVAAVVEYGYMARFSREQEVKFSEGIHVDFYDKKGVHTSALTADRGLLHERTNEVEALDNVVVVSDSGITLFTEHLRWNSDRQRISTEDFVTIATVEGDTLYGHGFESDPNLENWLIRNPTGVTQKKLALPRTGDLKKSREQTSQQPDAMRPNSAPDSLDTFTPLLEQSPDSAAQAK